MLIEPFAADDLADNLNPVGAAYYGFSTLLCTPAHYPRTSAPPSAPKPARPGCAKWSPAQVSPA